MEIFADFSSGKGPFYINLKNYRAFDKNKSVSGTPLIGEGGELDSDVCIIYGHNTKNGTMFGSLDQYAKQVLWLEEERNSIR